jgi:hypothetical protein
MNRAGVTGAKSAKQVPDRGVLRLKPLALFFVYMVTVANRAKDNK